MRLVSYLEAGTERLGVDADGRVTAVADLLKYGPPTMADLLTDLDAMDACEIFLPPTTSSRQRARPSTC